MQPKQRQKQIILGCRRRAIGRKRHLQTTWNRLYYARPSIQLNANAMDALLPAPPMQAGLLSGTFSGHETFPFRYAWLKKGIDGLTMRGDIFLRDEAMVELGVGKNMVRSIRHWCLATRVAEEREPLLGSRARQIVPSALGRTLFLEPGWDPYLEDDGSLWLLHWHLATNAARATTWYWAFNICKEHEFTRETLQFSLEGWIEKQRAESRGWSRISSASLKSDIACFLRTYAPGKRGPTSTLEETLDCPLTTLGLLLEFDGDRFRFNNGPKPGLAAPVFLYALLDFWAARHAKQETLSLREIAHGEGGPGRVFRLDDDEVLGYLDRLSELTGSQLVFNDTAMVRQVARRAEVEPLEVLRGSYQT